LERDKENSVILGLTIPDAHINQGQSLDRFVALGKLIVEERPDFVMIMGDWLGMHSLSHWELNKPLHMEGQRYLEAVRLGNEALDILLKPLHAVQETQRHRKEKLYSPDLYFLEGNHEVWAEKYVEQHPELEGFVDPISNLHLKERGFKVTPYKQYVHIGGVQFCHIPLDQRQKPTDGKYAVYNAFNVVEKSTIFAHTHRLEVACGRRHGGELIQLMSVGCVFTEDQDDAYTLGCPNPFWRGVVMVEIYKPGRYDIRTYGLDRLLGV
jgi:hypothetical protein